MKNIVMFIFLMLFGSLAFAETIHLKDGSTVNGKILQKDAQGVKADLNGIAMTYYADEIQDIDGQPFIQEQKPTPAVAPKAEPVSVVTPKVVPAVNPVPSTLGDLTDKRILILKFIEVFGTRKAMTQNFEGMIRVFEEKKPDDAKKIRERFKIDEIIERLIPLYDKYFTIEDLKAYITFYSSVEGQKLISSIGLIMKESIVVGTDYLKEKFPDMISEK